MKTNILLNRIRGILQLRHRILNTQTHGLMFVAFKMLIAQKKKFIGMIIAASFACFIMTQQPAMYLGFTERAVAFIASLDEADLFVMDAQTPYAEVFTHFKQSDIYRIKSLPGVLWAVSVSKTSLQLKHLPSKTTKEWDTIIVEKPMLIGMSKKMNEGARENIKKMNALIIDGAAQNQSTMDHRDLRLKLGDKMKLENNITLNISGIAAPLRTLLPVPVAYISLETYRKFNDNPAAFILVKAIPGRSIPLLAQNIHTATGYRAYTLDEFKQLTINYYNSETPLFINFAILSFLGFIIGLISIGQIFNTLTVSHLYQFGILKILGTSNTCIAKMLMFQSTVIGGIGYVFGVIGNLLFGLFVQNTIIAYHLTWTVLWGVFWMTLVISFITAVLSMRVVFKFDTVKLCQDHS